MSAESKIFKISVVKEEDLPENFKPLQIPISQPPAYLEDDIKEIQDLLCQGNNVKLTFDNLKIAGIIAGILPGFLAKQRGLCIKFALDINDNETSLIIKPVEMDLNSKKN